MNLEALEVCDRKKKQVVNHVISKTKNVFKKNLRCQFVFYEEHSLCGSILTVFLKHLKPTNSNILENQNPISVTYLNNEQFLLR